MGQDEDSDSDEWTEVPSKRPPLRAGKGRGKGLHESGAPSRPYQSNTPVHVSRQDRQSANKKVFVHGLTASTKENHLASAFRFCGQVFEAAICRHPNGTSKGIGFVTFVDACSADMAAREGGVRIDGKLCNVRLYNANSVGSTTTAGASCDSATATEARKEVDLFITRHELDNTTSAALQRADPMTALRVVRGIVAKGPNGHVSEGLVHAELRRVAGSSLSQTLERSVTTFVNELATLGLSADTRDKVLSMFLAQRPEEIEHILELSRRPRWVESLVSKDNPALWLLTEFTKFTRQRARADIEAFTMRFNFGDDVMQKLCELSSEKARRLMKAWNPSAPGTQSQLQNEFLETLEKDLHEHRWQKARRRQNEVGTVGSHAVILQAWSDDEEEVEWRPPEAVQDTMGGSGASEAKPFEAFDADSALPDVPVHRMTSQKSSSMGAGQRSSDGTSQMKPKRRQPKPTHFIMCVDSSGSMIASDCISEDGEAVTRLSAVLEMCSRFITESSLNIEDRYSFVTFNEEVVLHFSLYKAFDAQTELESLQPVAKSQTKFSMGIRGIHAAIRQNLRLPARVVFLSDGEPSDPGSYLQDVQRLVKQYPGDALKIYAVGFGESAKVNAGEGDFTYLQQLASLGHGHFQRCGASLSSLQGAFTAVTSTISRTRSASSAGRHADTGLSTSSPSVTSSQGALQLRPYVTSVGPPGQTPPVTAQRPQMPATIQEGADGGADSSDESGGSDAEAADVRPLPVEFELPDADKIFTELHNDKKWRYVHAAQTSFTFDGHMFSRNVNVKRVFLRQKPFLKGGMRLVYGMLHEEDKAKLQQDTQVRMCAKRMIQDLDKEQGFQAHSAFCKSTAVAQYFSKMFKQALKNVGTKHRLVFLDCFLYSPTGGDKCHFCGEKLLKGHFTKLNSNAGFVNEADYSEHSEIAQAFSHFTFDQSRGELMVVDLQGMCAESKDGPYSILTDPQVHSRGSFETFGPGDLRTDGIRKFFQKHKCGETCRKLNLRKEFEIEDPTMSIPMPGVPGLLKHMLSQSAVSGDSKEFYGKLRRKHRISSIQLPREAHSDWVHIRIWAEKRLQVNKVLESLQGRMEEYFNSARRVVVVDQAEVRACSAERWQRQFEQLKQHTNALVIPYPADWKAKSQVQEIWVFFDSGHAPESRDWAVQEVKKSLKNLAKDGFADEQNAKQDATEKKWEQYQDDMGQRYWYRDDGQWFYENDRRWKKFQDDSKKSWWWNEGTGDWFYEP